MSPSPLEDWLSQELKRAALTAPEPSGDMSQRVMRRRTRSASAAVLSVAAAVALVIAGAVSLPVLVGHRTALSVANSASPRPSVTPDSSSTPSEAAGEPCGQALPGGSESAYVGLTLAEARQRARTHGLVVRTLGIDGICHPVPADLSFQRVNVYIEKGRVAWASVG